MTSFNHYALGAVADFLHRVVAGLAPAEPGYRTILIRPRPGGGLTSASAKIATTFGDASVSWRRNGATLEVDVTVPEGASATVDVDGCPTTQLGPGTHTLIGTCRAAVDDPVRPERHTPFDEIASDAA